MQVTFLRTSFVSPACSSRCQHPKECLYKQVTDVSSLLRCWLMLCKAEKCCERNDCKQFHRKNIISYQINNYSEGVAITGKTELISQDSNYSNFSFANPSISHTFYSSPDFPNNYLWIHNNLYHKTLWSHIFIKIISEALFYSHFLFSFVLFPTSGGLYFVYPIRPDFPLREQKLTVYSVSFLQPPLSTFFYEWMAH